MSSNLPKKQRNFSRISTLASKKRSNQINKGTLYLSTLCTYFFIQHYSTPQQLELDLSYATSCKKIYQLYKAYGYTLIEMAIFHVKTPIMAKFKFGLKKYAKLKLRYIAKGIWTQKVWIQSYSCCRIAQTWQKSSSLPILENFI